MKIKNESRLRTKLIGCHIKCATPLSKFACGRRQIYKKPHVHTISVTYVSPEFHEMKNIKI